MTTRNIQLHRLPLAGVLTLGATIVLLVVGMTAGKFIVNRWCQNETSERLMILPNGTPVIATGEADRNGPVCRALDGRPVKASAAYYGSVWPKTANVAFLASPVDSGSAFTELIWGQRLAFFPGNYYGGDDNAGMSWYFVHDGKLEGHGYFVGFDNKTKLRIGYISRDGACADEPAVDRQVAVNGRRMASRSSVFFVSRYDESDDLTPPEVAAQEKHGRLPPFTIPFLADDGLMLVNFKEQTLTCPWKDDKLVSAALTSINSPENASAHKQDAFFQQVFLLRSPDQVHVVDVNGREVQTYRLPEKLQDHRLQWLQLPDGNALVRPGLWDWDDELFWIAPKGNVVRHELVKVEKHSEFDGLQKKIPLSLSAPSPATIAVVAACGSWASFDDPPSTWYLRSLGRAFTDGWLPLVVAALSVISALLCYRRQRAYALSWTAACVAFVFLTGLPGYIGYLAHRRWSARLPCPHCGQRPPRSPVMFRLQPRFPATATQGH